ncbi:MAG: dihydroorotate dehydrogenase-like protein [Chthoniobacterales bacterium]
MNLSTNYLGLKLKNPLMPGASPLVDNLDTVRRLEDVGAAAIVMHSLFEEQITTEDRLYTENFEQHNNFFNEAQSFMPDPLEFALTPDHYLAQIARIKEAVQLPVIASLNGTTLGGWVNYAHLMEEAGADALELNFYFISTSPTESGGDVLKRATEILEAVKSNVTIPVAVKLSPFFTALPHIAQTLVNSGANGLVLFNRFYQPDIDIETLEVVPALRLSDSSELLLRLRWLAILSASVKTSYAVTGGVHLAKDAIKAIMTGADAVQMVSALLKRGPDWLGGVLDEMTSWLEEHEYESLDQLRGSMSLRHCPDPAAFERANYLRVLQGWRP